jgi:hypothetical protein
MNRSDMLCRFFEHDDNDDTSNITWCVSGGSLEDSKRYYRIMYDNSITKLERELVIDVKDSKVLLQSSIVEFKRSVSYWFASTSEDFIHQVKKMFISDPWLSLYDDDRIYMDPVD